MCGIAGKFKRDSNCVERESILSAMKSALHRRGPDDSGIYSFKDITLGHTRLAIIDLTTHAAQPMTDEKLQYCTTYNGEVYNYRELRNELQNNGYTFQSTSDTEVVLKAYIHWGPACFEKFNGMFAVAIWDNAKEELILARDPFGKKPLYYCHAQDGSMSFASTITALMKDPDIPRKVSMEAINCFLAIGYILAPLSIIDNVHKLEPAHYLIFNTRTGLISKTQYWNYAEYFHNKSHENEPDACNNIQLLLRQAVKQRMISDVPLGAFLSGGLDSSSIVAIMKELDSDVRAFSIGFSDPEFNELEYAQAAAKSLSVNRHYCSIMDTKQIPAEMDSLFEAFDEPFADTSLIPMLFLSAFARTQVTVALSGDGGDEIFGGYPTYQADRLARGFRTLPHFIQNMLGNMGNQIKVRLHSKVGLDYKAKQFLHGAQSDEEKSHYSWRLMFTPEERIQILGHEHRQLVHDTDPFNVFQKYYRDVAGLSSLDRHLYVDAKTWLADGILVKLDRTTMFFGLEGRCPYLDKNLAEYAASLPADMKVRHFQLKYLLKKSLSGIVPEIAIKRKKAGFNAPVGKWVQLKNKDTYGSLSDKNEYSQFVQHVLINFLAKKGYNEPEQSIHLSHYSSI